LLTMSQYKQIKQAADASGLGMSAYMRQSSLICSVEENDRNARRGALERQERAAAPLAASRINMALDLQRAGLAAAMDGGKE
jgi:hypothetical protein